MEDISRDREEEDRPLEEERRPERRRERYEVLPEMSYHDEYEENIRKDMDVIFNPEFINQDGVKFNHRKGETIRIRKYLLGKILSEGIPAKFNSSASSSDVFKNTVLERDRKKPSPIIYVKYKDRTAFSYNTIRGDVEKRLRETNKEVFSELKNDLNREIVEFKNGTFAGQVTTQFEQFSDRPDPTVRAWRPTYRDVDDAQKEIGGKMRMEFESGKYDLESQLRQEENRRRRAEDNLERTVRYNRESLQEVNRQLKEREERIRVLEDQFATQNFSQFGRDSVNIEIQELKAEISRLSSRRSDLEEANRRLRKDLDDQQESIQNLQKQVNEKQKRIEELEKKGISQQDKRQLDQLRREKADLEKQLEAQKQRTKIAQEDRDKWKEYDKKSEATLAAKGKEILSLTKERDDLKKSIEALREVGSKKVKEFEDYKVEAERKLDRAKAEYMKEKAELESAYQRDISELESVISELSEKKEEFSDSEISSLKSSLENRNIVIHDLEEENFRLRDLNLSLKEIDEGNEREYNRKLEEIDRRGSSLIP